MNEGFCFRSANIELASRAMIIHPSYRSIRSTLENPQCPGLDPVHFYF